MIKGNKQKKNKKIVGGISANIVTNIVVGIGVVLIIGSLSFLQRLFMPKYMGKVVEGALIAEYYQETTKHDVIFIGDCEVYENFSPITLWENYGITSYIRGSAQQLIWQSYYLLEETLQYEKPDVIVFNVLAMQYNEPQKEAYNRMTLDGMRWSLSKVKSIQESMLEEESFLEYLFPLLRYHSRWSELTKEDWKYLWKKDTISHNGYYMRVDVKGAAGVPPAKKLANYEFGERAYFYLDKIRLLCEKNGIALILVKAPSIYPHWYEEWDLQMEEYAKQYGLAYFNFLELFEETGVDLSVDTYDGGLHLNLSGAEKLSKYFGEILSEEYGILDHRGEAKYDRVWEQKIAFYYAEKEKQLADREWRSREDVRVQKEQ